MTVKHNLCLGLDHEPQKEVYLRKWKPWWHLNKVFTEISYQWWFSGHKWSFCGEGRWQFLRKLGEGHLRILLTIWISFKIISNYFKIKIKYKDKIVSWTFSLNIPWSILTGSVLVLPHPSYRTLGCAIGHTIFVPAHLTTKKWPGSYHMIIWLKEKKKKNLPHQIVQLFHVKLYYYCMYLIPHTL